jgi:hypothetical protein
MATPGDPVEMKKNSKHQTAINTYQIRVSGRLDQRWSEWFDNFQIEYQDDYSIITGPVIDQPALHGVFAKIRDLGLEILLVEKTGMDQVNKNDRKTT